MDDATTMEDVAEDAQDFETGGGSANVQRNGDEATNGNGNGTEDDIEREAEAEGIIYPPREIRQIVDKTAAFVARNPPQFEERIRENERANPKFSFLNPRDPYHAYYQFKIRLTREGRGEGPAADGAAGAGGGARASAPKKKEKEPPKEPPAFEFVVEMPGISAQDLDVLLHTAQFTARNGRQFLTSLAQREARNPQFDFLRPNHSLFPYFTKMVEQYTKVLVPSKELMARLEENKEDSFKILERVMMRVEWKLYTEEQKRKKEEEEDAERIAFAEIDWQDFVVVETVEFTGADEHLPLPPPTRKLDLEHMTLAEKNVALAASAPGANQTGGQEDDGEGEMEVEMDEDEEEAPAPPPRQPPPPTAPAGPMAPMTAPTVGGPMPGFPLQPGMMPPPGMAPPGMAPPGMAPPGMFPMMPGMRPGGFPPGFPPPGMPPPGFQPGVAPAFPMPGMPMPPGMPPAMPVAQPPLAKPAHEREEEEEEEEMDSKRQKIEEEAFTVDVETASVPDKAAEWGLNGSTIQIPSVLPSITVGQLKEKIQQLIKMPSSRQKLSTPDGVVMKNTSTLGSYKIKAGDKLALDVRAK